MPQIRKCAFCGKVFIADREVECCSKECSEKYRLQRKAEAEERIRQEKKQKHCKRKKECFYGKQISSDWICDYFGMTRILRNCPPDTCDKFRKKGRVKVNPFSGEFEEEVNFD